MASGTWADTGGFINDVGSEVVLFRDVIEEILRDVAPLKRRSTQELYFIYLGELKIELGNKSIKKWGRKEYMLWIRDFKSRKDRKTFFDYTKYLNIIFRFAYQEKYINHWIKFPNVDGEICPKWRVYSQEEISNLVLAMSGSLLIQFILSYECFMRLREVLYLTWDRVDLDRRVIVLRSQDVKTGSRTGMGRDIPLSPNAYHSLKTLKHNSISIFVFPSPSGNRPQHENRKAWATAKNSAGIVGRARWHDIRHTALSYAVMVLKIPLAHLSKVAGVSIKTLERVYLHHEVEDVREVTAKMNALKKSS